MPGTIPLFRVLGVDVRLHWLWIILAVFQVTDRSGRYTWIGWNVAEYLSLFFIVLLHEFGHVTACRSVGGRADRILLWPLGGVAFVEPPQRPGALLWTIAAGPLVNLVLVLPLAGLLALAIFQGWADSSPDAHAFAVALAVINGVLLVFNLLPIYPLDGGQILRAVLWFMFGRTRSLSAASVVGFLGAIGLILLAVAWGDVWLGVLAVFVVLSCAGGWRRARAITRAAAAPRREGFACPACAAIPAAGPFWFCRKCGRDHDPFATGRCCLHCGDRDQAISCLDCEAGTDASKWSAPIPGGASP